MNIAIGADGQSLNSKVSEQFDSCNYLVIVNMDDSKVVIAIKNEDSSEDELAEKVIQYDCEALITGKLNPTAFNILTEACVTRYLGLGHSVETALDLMERQLLRYIKNPEGTDECDGPHHKH
ncbi:NifB/NifX family molybdenum-iron cluster-binding protein [Sporomusa sp. KB1]|uniref:NifB/NifX family molybdenum-iron cluster-binding protein n=1 Tax=Sporomusa sp. KB1 TaxID=943346 RepID=UPI00119F226B|nr:NifB/NifX family molybdenum-iron cluster-binding protein [Sporomusa sp. KB1]TWH48124.1 putative Fe-Mo cluster-binding NifX family protein [Sporomusa sp. KB1]